MSQKFVFSKSLIFFVDVTTLLIPCIPSHKFETARRSKYRELTSENGQYLINISAVNQQLADMWRTSTYARTDLLDAISECGCYGRRTVCQSHGGLRYSLTHEIVFTEGGVLFHA